VPLRSNHFAGNTQLENALNNNPPLLNGAAGDGVALLQQALLDLGISLPISTGNGARSPDGIYGEETAARVKTFQAQMGLRTDGIAGHDTILLLDSLYVAQERPKPPGALPLGSATTARRGAFRRVV
jgi:peptidoglycan hydrolase-like protein with peptidoglycan-binding domain